MISKLKKLFSFLFLILLGLLFPNLSSANFVADLALWIPSRLILLIVSLAVQLAILIVGLSGSLLNWVLSPNFINLSYTNPAKNQVIETGLGITQGFVNMLLVLVLVYIAIATILRLAGYETKKLLVTFIVVALLVNFAPVICGLIVDASNIVMNFFIQDLKADAFGQAMGAKVTQISSGFDWTKFELSGAFGTIFQLCIMVGFLFYLSLILGIFTLIFILRYLAIWLLVILSPLAFVCYILPATKKYFEQWWQQFLAWSFIGVTCGFFLYLGLLMVSLVPTAITAPTTGQGGLFDQILPFFVSVVFLGLGIVFGLQTSALGAKTAVNIASTKGKATARWTGRQARAGAARILGEKGQRWAARQASTGLPTLKGKGAFGKIGTIAGYATGVAPAIWAIRRGIGAAGLGLVEKGRSDVRKAEAKYKGTTAERKASAITMPRISIAERVAALGQAVEEGQIEELKDLGINEKEIIKIGKQSLKINPEEFKKIRDAFPHLAEEIGKGFSEKARKKAGVMSFDDDLKNLKTKQISLKTQISTAKPGKTKTALEEEFKKIEKEIKEVENDKMKFGAIETKIVAKIKPDFITKLSKESLKSKNAKVAIHQFWTPQQLTSAIGKLDGQEFLETFEKDAKNILKTKGDDFYKKNNPALYNFSKRTPGRILGMPELGS